MLKSEMQHQFWITKKTVQRKFGSKEDEHIISSDAQLDSKVEVFKSISATSAELSKIVDQYQERLCILSQEESVFGRFLKEAGNRSKTTGQTIVNAGKAVSCCGQQRMCARVPLLRLQHEVDVFRYRAISDMQNTITDMEKERTEYRASLEWMKSVSSELDPDTGRGLDKFRTAQSHVRSAKQVFDSLTMDSIQKIDLLAAARCNMFSHVLVAYMLELKQFAQKTHTTFETVSRVLEQKPKYDFCILKELTQDEGIDGNVGDYKTQLFDKDQTLFFAKDYADDEHVLSEQKSKEFLSGATEENLVQLCNNAKNIMDLYDKNQNEPVEDKNDEIESINEKSAEMLSRILNTKFFDSPQLTPIPPTSSCEKPLPLIKSTCSENDKTLGTSKSLRNEMKTNKNMQTNPWIELFADLDPLANLEAFDLKLSGASKNFQHA